MESPVYAQRDATNQLVSIGVTPTMFPEYFYVDDGSGTWLDGARDLAPDDIAAASFLYPRGNQDAYFSIEHWARTNSRVDIPSIPAGGGLVVAWLDADNDSSTARIPFVGTMSGLLENPTEYENVGRFRLDGLRKEVESMGTSSTFQATYTFSFSPINGYDVTHMAPANYEAEDFKSVDNSNDTLNTSFISEVFVEGVDTNKFGIRNHDLGTAVAFDRIQGAVVFAASGNKMPTRMTWWEPMFGDPPPCPINVSMGEASSGTVSAALRGFRDNHLMPTALGAVFVDAYYKMAPSISGFLLGHERVLGVTKYAASLFEWLFAHGVLHVGLLMLAALGVFLGIRRLGRRARMAGLSIMLMAGLGAWAPAASALGAYVTTEEMVDVADYIVDGVVTEVAARWTTSKSRVVTDVSVQITGSLKGAANKSQRIVVSMPGGRVGPVVTKAIGAPIFKKGREVRLFLNYKESFGYVVVGGARGKYEVLTDKKTGVKYLAGVNARTKKAITAKAAKLKSSEERQEIPPGLVLLEEYDAYLHEIIKKSARR